MKPFYFITACLCLYAFSAYSQTDKPTDGDYVFSKVVLTVYNYNTKAEVFTRTLEGVDSLEELKNLPYPFQPVFLSATIKDGILRFCKLWNSDDIFSVQENGKLLVPGKLNIEQPTEHFNPFSQPYYLHPNYKLELDGNTATFTFSEPYGHGAFRFGLEGKFVIILVKEETE